MRRLLGVMAVTVMLMAACGGDDKKDVDASDSDETTSTTLASDTTVTTAAGAPGAATTVAGGRTATTARAAATATTASNATSGKAPVPATPGTYDYAQSGTSTAGNVPANGTLTVDPANASGVQVFHRRVDPAQPPGDTTIAFRANGPFITDVVQRQQQFEVKCHFADPGVPAPPWPADPGKPISGKANCGQIQVEVSGSITGKRTTQLDGQTIEVVVATVTIKTTGQIESTSTETQWWSPALRLTVHSESQTKGRFGAFPFESNIKSDLKSGKPR
jgi:hypothetical protein